MSHYHIRSALQLRHRKLSIISGGGGAGGSSSRIENNYKASSTGAAKGAHPLHRQGISPPRPSVVVSLSGASLRRHQGPRRNPFLLGSLSSSTPVAPVGPGGLSVKSSSYMSSAAGAQSSVRPRASLKPNSPTRRSLDSLTKPGGGRHSRQRASPAGRAHATSTSRSPGAPTPTDDDSMSWQLLVGLCFLAIFICYADRSNISTAILPMSKEYDWDKSFQGIVLSAFFVGYSVTQILGGRLADQYGGKLVLAAGVAIWSICTVATPWAASCGGGHVIACRILLGVGEGVAFPAVHTLIARGVPQTSQSTSVGIVTASCFLGTAMAFGLAPFIIQEAGWEWTFYLFGSAAVLWLPIWLPLEPPVLPMEVGTYDLGSAAAGRATEEDEEGAPLLTDVPSTSGAAEQDQGGAPALAAAPEPRSAITTKNLMLLLRRKEVLAICIAQYTQSWGIYGLISWLPTFFSEFYHVEIGDLSGFTMTPYIVQGGMGALSGIAADSMISKGFSVRSVRIGLQVAGMLGPAACLMVATSPIAANSVETGSMLINIGLGLSALTLGAVSVSHLDIAPRNAGIVFGAANTCATIAGLLAVPVSGMILDATDSWALVFGLIAAHYVVGAIVWSLWLGSERLKEDSL